MVASAKNPFKTMYKGTTFDTKNFNRPEGAGNFDNMDDYNIVKTVNAQVVNAGEINISGVPLGDQYVNVTGDTMTGDLNFTYGDEDGILFEGGTLGRIYNETSGVYQESLIIEAGSNGTGIVLKPNTGGLGTGVTIDTGVTEVPFTVASSTKVNNLNVDMTDGFHMDQNVLTTSSPAFIDLFMGDGSNPVTIDFNGSETLIVSSGKGASFTFSNSIVTGGSLTATSINANNLQSGTYTPTLTNVANLAASTAYQCQWTRLDNMVTVSGKVDVDPTLTATATQLGISLPVASSIGAQEDCAGVAFASGVAGLGAAIRGDAGNDRAEMAYISTDTTNQPMYFTFTYEAL